MLEPRRVLKNLFVYFLLGSLFGVAPGVAQDTIDPADGVRLRLSYGGAFLPRGTALVVLADQNQTEPGRSPQPLFLAPDAYPLETASALRRDTLGVGAATGARYPKTKSSGNRYFVYARTPDERTYWSYSALRDSIKYDTIDWGVMAVAPIADPAARERVSQTFFDPPAVAATAPAEPGTVAPTPEEAAPEDAMGSEMTLPDRDEAGILLPAGAFFLFLALPLACIAGLLFLTLHYRARLALKTVPAAASTRFDTANGRADQGVALERELAEIKANYERLQKTYNVLLDRHKTLIREAHGGAPAPQEPSIPRLPQEPHSVNP